MEAVDIEENKVRCEFSAGLPMIARLAATRS
jgi:hypothetical protein